MDVDAYVAAHEASWRRLEHLVARARVPRRLSGAELDELVDLYQRTATHLSVVRSASPDPRLVARLSTLVARSRAAVAGARNPAWKDAGRFVAVTFPAAAYRLRWWVLGVGIAFTALAVATGAWVASSERAQSVASAPPEVRQLVERDFVDYYSSEPAGAFASRVFTNNARVGAVAFAVGGLLCVPTVLILAYNAVNVGMVGGLMVAYGRGDVFFGLILPHGLLELTAVMFAGAAGLRIGWSIIDPGPRRRVDAAAEEGRAALAVVIGLVGAFFVAGLIEAYVTPSGLPTAARIAIGAIAFAAFLGYVGVLGRRAVAAGETGDLLADLRGDRLPTG